MNPSTPSASPEASGVSGLLAKAQARGLRLTTGLSLLIIFIAMSVVFSLLSPYFLTVDNFTNFFTYLAVLFAVRVAVRNKAAEDEDANQPGTWRVNPFDFFFFGIALGMAVASKVSSVPLALLLPLAALIALYPKTKEERIELLRPTVLYIGLAAFLSLLVFRIAQPYTFVIIFILESLTIPTMANHWHIYTKFYCEWQANIAKPNNSYFHFIKG